jgi:hypothetical protein
MGGNEKKISDNQGQFMHAVQAGRENRDADWHACRIVLTSQRLVLIADDKQTIPLSDIDRLEERFDVNQAAATTADYTSVRRGEDVVLVTASDHDSFETDLYRAMLDDEIIIAKHPAVEGGVVQDTEWTKAKIKITDDAVRLALADGQQVVIGRNDIGDVETDERTAMGEQRQIFEVEHTDEDGRSVETHLTGSQRHRTVLGAILQEGLERHEANLDLDPTEKQVIMALHSGVSPFDIADFVGTDVERVEEIYDQLLEYDVIEVVRERTEVELTPQGRNVAGDAMGNQ